MEISEEPGRVSVLFLIIDAVAIQRILRRNYSPLLKLHSMADALIAHYSMHNFRDIFITLMNYYHFQFRLY